jgi:hypothetical protein
MICIIIDNTIIKAVSEISSDIWTLLQQIFMLSPTTEKWSKVAKWYNRMWDLPNFVGPINGKHF